MRLCFPFIFLLFVGCSRVPLVNDICVSSLVKTRIDQDVFWNQNACRNDEIKCIVHQLLLQELTADSAVQIALLNNPEIQAIFEELGIAHADLVEAGLLSNPIFDLTARFPNKAGLKTDIEYSITASFLDLFLMPLRKRIAEAEFEAVKFRVSNAILDLAFEVQEVYYEIQAAQSQLQYIQDIAEIASIQADIASRQLAIENIYKLDFQLIEAHSLEAELEIDRIDAEIIHLREKLNKLLGLCVDVPLYISDNLPVLDYQEFPIERLEAVAFRERLDLQVARWEVIRISRMLGIKQWWVYTQGRLGISSEIEPEGFTVFGPAISGAIPIFNWGQAARQRLFAELRQAQDRLASLEVQILSEVRESHKLLMRYLDAINKYQARLIPLQGKILESSEKLYNVMGVGVNRLLDNKRLELQTYNNYILSLRNYWITRVELDRALGGKLYMIFPYENSCICQEGVSE
jgi:cobalt-zinc-cadmium efflux system outer membrane protein